MGRRTLGENHTPMRYLSPILIAVFFTSSLSAADLTWDPSGSAGIQGGSGIWNTSLQNWTSDGGTSHTAWTNSSPTNIATFAGADGTYTVTISGITRTDGIAFNASGYTLSADSAQSINVAGNLSVASGKSATIGNNVDIYRASSYQIAGGGTLNITTGGTVRGSSSAISINGATVIVNSSSTQAALSVGSSQNLIIGNTSNSTSALTITNGSVVAGSNSGSYGLRYFGSNPSNSQGTVNLDGGTLETSRIYVSSATGSTSTFNFNGGTLKASGTPASGTDFMTGLTGAYVKEGGAKIDTNSFDITISQALLHGGTATKDGGLTKNSTGILTLSGANTYTGDTTVNAGTLLLADNAGMKFVIGANGVNNQINGAGTVTLNGDFAFDLTGAGTAVGNSWLIVNVGTLTESFGDSFTVAGFIQNNNIWTTTVSGVEYEFRESTGMLSVVPEPSTVFLVSFCGGILLFFRRRHSAAQE